MDTVRMSDDTTVNESNLLPMPDGATRLPSGGWALLKPVNMLTGRDVKNIRKAMNLDGAGDITNAAMAATLGALVADWQVPYAERLPLPVAGQASLDRLTWPDQMALERIARPIMREALGHEDKAATDPS